MKGDSKESIFDDKTRELVAIGAAIACNCEVCLTYHFNEARQLGISKEDIWSAVDMACKVRHAPANSIRGLAEKLCSQKAASSSCGCNSTNLSGGCC